MCGFGAVGTSSGLLPLLMTSLLAFAAVVGAGMGWGMFQGRRTGYGVHLEAQLTPTELLRERYAHGEIDLGEFEERAMLLMRSQLGPSHPLSHPSSDGRPDERTTL